MFIIAGLGNPGREYEGTRHNVGFDAVSAIAERYGIGMDFLKHKAQCGKGVIEGVPVMLLCPLTYMNLSGESVGEAVHYYKADPTTDLLVIFDDISLEPGNIRLRKKGSAGGHNGIKDIIAHLGTQDFARIKIGVGGKPAGWDLKDHVLGHFSQQERELVDEAIGRAVEAAAMVVQGRIDAAMNQFNEKKEKKEKREKQQEADESQGGSDEA
ncbi:MAG: aminoacyl-tRNA hydrolase [Clostridiales bacterium]|nr:aminoacyl-tRNA hydrolase [Clostridiales bacterium]